MPITSRFLAACSIALLAADARAELIRVPSGGDLQAAIDRAQPGDTVLLAPGATYVGNFRLPPTAGDRWITIRTAESPGQPAAGQRVLPAHGAALARLRSPNGNPALRTMPRAHHWRLLLLEFDANANGQGDIIALGDDDQRTLAEVPSNLTVERCYIHGDPAAGQKRGIALNSASTTIVDSHISGMRVRGQDSQAIAGWNGPGPFRIENNYLEAASENFLLGGSAPSIPGLIPSDVVFRRNHLTKPLAWREERRWSAKNLFELKNARRVLVEANVLEHSWREGQTGFAILLTPRAEGGRAPWATVESVVIRYNVIRHAGGAISILGRDDDEESGPARSIRIEHNLVYDVDRDRWGGTGAFLQLGLGPIDVEVVHNTVVQSGKIADVYGVSGGRPIQAPGFVFRDNIVRHNRYGVHGQSQAVGQDTLDAYFPGAVFSSNAIGGGDRDEYPDDNVFLADDELTRQFVDPSRHDYRLRAGSRLARAASDRTNLGADVVKLLQLLGKRIGSSAVDAAR